ncbi:MAG TPA: protein kinase [Kofleriaceae bacterium]|nr:protein kinase [Kofleriaceae bacterium]
MWRAPRDLKPENLIVAKSGRLRVLDFGLAKIIDAAPLDATVPGTVQGTAGYMAPEQARGEVADARADIFALGAIVFEVATGERAFPGATHADRLTAVLRDEPDVARLGPLAPVIGRCLAKSAAARFQSAADLAWTLHRELPVPAHVTRRGLVGAAGVAALAAATGYVLARRRPIRATSPRSFTPLTSKTGRVYTARFTPDQQRVAYGAVWDGEPVRGYLADLAPAATSGLDLGGDVLAISSRGELAGSLGRRFTEHQCATGTLAVRPLGGGLARTLAHAIQEADYAPGESLAVIRRNARGFAIELPLGVQLVESDRWLTHLRCSPDGRHVAYLEHPHTNDDGGALVVVGRERREPRVLVDNFASIAGLAWAPDGRTLWFTGARDHALSTLHAVTLDRARTAIAETPGRLRLHDVARDRRAVVTVDAWRLRTRAGDTAGARDCSQSEVSFVTDISADGALLAVAELGAADIAAGAYLVPIAGGTPLRLGPGTPLAIAPGGRHVVANIERALVIYDTASGERAVLAAPGQVSFVRWLDDRTLVAVTNGQLWRLARGGAPVQLAVGGGRLAVDATRRSAGPRCARSRAPAARASTPTRRTDRSAGRRHAARAHATRRTGRARAGRDPVTSDLRSCSSSDETSRRTARSARCRRAAARGSWRGRRARGP